MRLLIIILLFPIGLIAQLSGTYTVGGASPDYATPLTAVAALNSSGISGPVTFNIRNGTYRGKFILGNVSGVSSTDTILFQSENQDSTVVTIEDTIAGSGDNYVVQIAGTDYLTLRNLTMQSIPPYGDAQRNNTIWINQDATDTVNHLRIVNNIINGSTTNGSPSSLRACISTNSDATVDYPAHDWYIENNVMNDGSYGIYIEGDDSDELMERVYIRNNEINSFGSGIWLSWTDSAHINNNEINIAVGYLSNTDQRGIRIEDAGDIQIYNNYVYAEPCSADVKLIHVDDEISTGYDDNIKIYNNMLIRDSSYAGSSSTESDIGIYILDSSNVEVYFNSIFLNTYRNDIGTYGISFFSIVGGSATKRPIIKNNCIRVPVSASNYGSLHIDNSGTEDDLTSDYNNYNNLNDLYTVKVVTSYYTLAGWQTLESEDLNTVQIDPQYVSNTDIHTTNTALGGTGTVISWINTDYDGDARANPPAIGADEISGPTYEPAIQNGKIWVQGGKILRRISQ